MDFKLYFGFTVFSALLDFFAFIIILAGYGDPGSEYAEMTLMAFLFIFWGTNTYWIGQMILLDFKFPAYISNYLK